MAQTETSIDLPKRSDLTSARPIQEALLAEDGHVALRAGEVDVFTSPMLQVLIAARATFEDTDRDLTLETASVAFDDCLRVLGATRGDICTNDATESRP